MVAILLCLQKDPIEEAIRKGITHLRSQAATAGPDRELVLCALVEVGVRGSDPAVADLLKELLSRPPETTRSAALQARILLLLDRKAHRDRIGHCAQFLVDNQAADGLWGVGRAVDPPALRPEPPAPPTARTPNHVFGQSSVVIPIPLRNEEPVWVTGDAVNSFWALHGLAACRAGGMFAPRETLEKAERSWREVEADPAQRLTALMAYRSLLRRSDAEDPDLERAMAQVEARNLPDDPESLYLLRQAMHTWGRDKLGGKAWWPAGARILTDSQAEDGGWGDLAKTCAALRYLTVPRFLGVPEAPKWRFGTK